jgi:ubiquinone/menaquinone biosynthesis C-methylase UbiE
MLDVAGGTGDISFRILDKAKQDSPGSNNHFMLI